MAAAFGPSITAERDLISTMIQTQYWHLSTLASEFELCLHLTHSQYCRARNENRHSLSPIRLLSWDGEVLILFFEH